MRTVLCVGTFGPRDPTRATLPFVMALCAARAGDRAQIALMSDAALLLKEGIAQGIAGTEWPPLTQLLAEVVAAGIPIFVCAGCGGARGVSGDDLVTVNARFASPRILMELKVTADKLLLP